jgi:hypothetical protein
MRSIAVRHVGLVGEKDDVGRRHPLSDARQHRQAAQAGVE